MEIDVKDDKVIIEMDKKFFDYNIIDYINKFEKKNKNLFFEFALQNKGSLKEEDLANDEELHMQGD